MDNSTKEKIKESILNYCQGITWKEFNIDDLDNIVNDIEKAVEADKIITREYVKEHKKFTDEWGNSDWRDTGEMGG